MTFVTCNQSILFKLNKLKDIAVESMLLIKIKQIYFFCCQVWKTIAFPSFNNNSTFLEVFCVKFLN